MMARLAALLCAAVFVVTTLPAEGAAKGALPGIDLQKRCRRAASTIADMMADPSQRGSAFDTCMKSEQEARDALLKAWPEIPSQYKSFCIRPAVYSPSYVEWIACLEMMIDAKKLRENSTKPAKP